MRSIQEIFNVVIKAGIYNPAKTSSSMSSAYMCYALDHAYNSKNLITGEERKAAQEAIEEYVYSLCETTCWLATALSNNGLPHSPKDLLAVYQDWNNRPG